MSASKAITGCMSCGQTVPLDTVLRIVDAAGRIGLRCVACYNASTRRRKQLHAKQLGAQKLKSWSPKLRKDVFLRAENTIYTVCKARQQHIVHVIGIVATSKPTTHSSDVLTQKDAEALCRRLRVIRVAELGLANGTLIHSLPAHFESQLATCRGDSWATIGWRLGEWVATVATVAV